MHGRGSLLRNNGAADLTVDTVAQQWEAVNHGTHCKATMTSVTQRKNKLRSKSPRILAQESPKTQLTTDHVCTTMICMMLPEEYLWNVNVLERVHLSNLVHNGGNEQRDLVV
jgi:broad specificity polyphosphatase/5'/3'-nucleotidase SurE